MTKISEPLWVIGVALLVVLVAALVLSSVARFVLGRRARLRTSTAIVVSILGSAFGLLLVSTVFSETRLISPIPILACFAGSVVLIAGYSTLAARFQAPQPPAGTAELLAGGETDHVEFKSTARVNMRTGEKDARMEAVIVKTLSAFLNADGGTLLVGVDDDGKPLGLDADFQTLRIADADRYELWLHDLISTSLGQNAAAATDVTIESLATDDGPRDVCRIDVGASPRPIYLTPSKNASREFWVRTGNSSRQLTVDQAAEYIMHRWPLSIGSSLSAQLRAAVRFTDR